MSVRLAIAQPDDLPAVLDLLRRADLPEAELGGQERTEVFVATNGEQTMGCAALEMYGRSALLRSVAVEPDARGSGLGGRLTAFALERARQHGVSRVYLLTETAEPFFARRHFVAIDRDAVPDDVKGSVEFASACPASAQAMMLDLTRNSKGV